MSDLQDEFENVTTEAPVFEEYDVSLVELRLFVLILISSLSSVGNILVLLLTRITHRYDRAYVPARTTVVDNTIASIAFVGIVRGFTAMPFQVSSFVNRKWIFGNAFCQIQAFTDALFRYLFLWYASLLIMDRYTKHLKPHEYLITFTPLILNVILPGIFLVVTVQVTGPIYGWGRYGYIPDVGACGLVSLPDYGCSYVVYILSSLCFPPVLLMSVCWVFLSLRRPVSPDDLTKRDMSPSRSRLLDSEKEIPTILLFALICLLLSLPRYIMDGLIGCECVCRTSVSAHLFTFSCLENCTGLVLPAICIAVHRRVRTTLKLMCQRPPPQVTSSIEEQELPLRRP